MEAKTFEELEETNKVEQKWITILDSYFKGNDYGTLVDTIGDNKLHHMFLMRKSVVRVGCTYKEVCKSVHNFAQILYFAAKKVK